MPMSRQSLAVKSSGADYRHLACRNLFTIDFHRDVERPAGLGHCVRRRDFDLYFAHWELLLGADLHALDDEEVVLVAENAVLHETGEAPRVWVVY
jgi:hypothetical protein